MPIRRTPHVAYFCMEFGVDPSFPIYSGGLGILAGDFIKSAHDLKRPVVGVGLRWERGFSEQRIDADGQPYDQYPTYDHGFLQDTGVRVRVRVRGNEVTCAVRWTERYGHVPLFLLEPVHAADRWITHRLYEAGTDVRIAQEMLLGIGGVRALNWLGIPISTYHFNEGHAVFAGIELICSRMEERNYDFPAAWAAVRRHIVFTTHTPVLAGNEEHPLKELRRMGACLQLSGAEMRTLGGDPFNMTVAGLRLARKANAVAALHGETARAMWKHVDNAAPITHVTNGVHVPTWQDARIRAAQHDPAKLAASHAVLKGELLAEVERRNGVKLDPGSLTIGFARRAAGYKRSDLILRDEVRLEGLLANHPVNLLFSGKAHPDDRTGKAIVARLVKSQQKHPGRVVFIENYEMAIARTLVRGADVWLNNPTRPLEASGTSGMKAAMNGVLNLSILDGWWPEGCRHGETGWAIGDNTNTDDDTDLKNLYRVLEGEVLPTWNDPPRWQRMMVESVRMGETQFSSDRMVNDYFAIMYAEQPAPAAEPPPVATPDV